MESKRMQIRSMFVAATVEMTLMVQISKSFDEHGHRHADSLGDIFRISKHSQRQFEDMLDWGRFIFPYPLTSSSDHVSLWTLQVAGEEDFGVGATAPNLPRQLLCCSYLVWGSSQTDSHF